MVACPACGAAGSRPPDGTPQCGFCTSPIDGREMRKTNALQLEVFRKQGDSEGLGVLPKLPMDAKCSCGSELFEIFSHGWYECHACHSELPDKSKEAVRAERRRHQLAHGDFRMAQAQLDFPTIDENPVTPQDPKVAGFSDDELTGLAEKTPDEELGIDLMLVTSALIYCQTCSALGLAWSRLRHEWYCTTCEMPGFGELSRVRHFVGLKTHFAGFCEGLLTPPAKITKPDDFRMLNPRHVIKLFSQENALELLKQKSDSDSHKRRKEVLEKLVKAGNRRRLSPLPRSWDVDLDMLADDHPNFRDVIEMNVRPSLAVLAAGGAVRPAPLLLLGEPGVGKSYFASQLAKLIGAPKLMLDMASAQSGSSLTGSSAFWDNSTPGQLFDLLLYGAGGIKPTANPIAFLDEIDKVSPDLKFNPLAGLYSLLEIESAKHFEDLALPGFELNASHVRWILAANDAEGIPSPIRSRCQIFTIPSLTRDQKISTFLKIFAGVVKSCDLDEFDDSLPKSVLEEFVDGGMREFKTLTSVAIGRALSAGRTAVNKHDFRQPLDPAATKRRIGFMP